MEEPLPEYIPVMKVHNKVNRFIRNRIVKWGIFIGFNYFFTS